MASPLARVPGLAGYLQQQQMVQQQEAGQLQQFGQVAGLRNALMQMEVAKQQRAQDAEARAALQASGGDPVAAANALLKSGNAAGAAKLAPLIQATKKPEPKEFAPPELIRLQEYLGTLPQGDPRRAPVEARIKMLGERQGGVNVYSGSPVAGVDEQGNPVFFQPSGQPGVAPRILPGVKPPPKAGSEAGLTAEAAGKVAMSQQAIQAVDTVEGLVFDKSGGLNKGLLLAMSVPGTAGLPGNTNARVARSAIRNAVEAKLRLETGAAATTDEINRTLDRFLPTVSDTKESAKFKLDELRKFFQMSLAQTKGLKPEVPSIPKGQKRLKFDAQGNPVVD